MKDKKTGFKEVKVYVAANGYTLYFKDYRGDYTSRDFFTAKTLDEVKKLCAEHLIEPSKI